MKRTCVWTTVLGLLVMASCSTSGSESGFESVEVGAIQACHRFDDVYLASQPSEADLREARDEFGLKTVVNIRLPEEVADIGEQAMVERLGLDYVNVPFRGPETLTDSVFEQLRAVLRDRDRRPMVVH